MREYHVTKILFLIVSSWFFNILLSTSCAVKKNVKNSYIDYPYMLLHSVKVVSIFSDPDHLFIYVLCTCVPTIPHSIKPYFDYYN